MNRELGAQRPVDVTGGAGAPAARLYLPFSGSDCRHFRIVSFELCLTAHGECRGVLFRLELTEGFGAGRRDLETPVANVMFGRRLHKAK